MTSFASLLPPVYVSGYFFFLNIDTIFIQPLVRDLEFINHVLLTGFNSNRAPIRYAVPELQQFEVPEMLLSSFIPLNKGMATLSINN